MTRQRQQRRRIVRALFREPKGLRAKDLGRVLRMPPGTVRRELGGLMRDLLVLPWGDSPHLYRLTSRAYAVLS